MLREWGSPTLFLRTFSCAEYDNVHIARYLKKLNDDHSDIAIRYQGSALKIRPTSVSRKFSSNFHDLLNTAIRSVLGVVEHFFWKKEYQMRRLHIIMSYGLKEHLCRLVSVNLNRFLHGFKNV